jgi:hypothetical protein
VTLAPAVPLASSTTDAMTIGTSPTPTVKRARCDAPPVNL